MIATLGTWSARIAGLIFSDIRCRFPAPMNVVYLTYDDGPSHGTDDLLDLLSAHGAPCTFFLRGDRIQRNSKVAARIIADGHTVGNHTFAHLDSWRNDWNTVRNDLDRGTRAFIELTGSQPQWMRPPYGRFRLRTLRWCRENNQQMVLWDVMASDFTKSVNVEELTLRVLRQVRPGSIIVLHDGDEHRYTLDVTSRILRSLHAEGWAFAALPQL